jgi:general secretion pathway protein H
MTLLEIMIVLAIVGLLTLLLGLAYRVLGKADLVEDSNELVAILRRTSTLAIEHGELHRLVLDLDKQAYVVEVCRGQLSIQRNEALRADEETKKRAIDKAKDRMAGMPADTASPVDPEEAARRAVALSGHHISDRTCVSATDTVTGDASGKGWARRLRVKNGIKFKEVWVQHRDDSATKGQVAIYFFPNGTSEKSVVEVTDGSDVFTVTVTGLTGRVDLRSGELHDVNEIMLRNAIGEKNARREDQR